MFSQNLIWESHPVVGRRRCLDYNRSDAHFAREHFGRLHTGLVSQMTVRTAPAAKIPRGCVAAQAAAEIISLCQNEPCIYDGRWRVAGDVLLFPST